MQNPEIEVRQVRTTEENELFIDLVLPMLNEGKTKTSPYRLKQILPGTEGMAYAIYEVRHDIMAVQFYFREELLTFGNDEALQFMTMDEIKFIKELGEVTIDGITYSVDTTTFNIIDGVAGCQRMIVFNLKTQF